MQLIDSSVKILPISTMIVLRNSGKLCRNIQLLVSRRMSAAAAAVTSQLDLRGVYPPIATPFDTSEEIAYKQLEANLHKWNKVDFKGKSRDLSLKLYLAGF